MDLLRHIMDGWPPEDAATRALAHILDTRTSPGMADAFVKLIGSAGVPAFRADRVEHEASRSDDSRPAITLRDASGKPRVLVATTFWNGVHDSQPVLSLRDLPEDAPSALVFIAPRERIRGLWSELRRRCQDGLGSDLRDESSPTGDPAWARAGRHVLMIASWRHVLDQLRRQAADRAVEQDIDELLGLVDQTDRRAFTPLEPSEVTDVELARWLIEFARLVDRIAERIEENGVAKLVSRNPYWSTYPTGWLRHRSMLMHDAFRMRIGIHVKAWRDLGTTPLWCVLEDVVGHWRRVKAGLDDARSYGGRLHIPIRLPADGDEVRTIDGAVEQMRRVADRLATTRDELKSSRPSRSPTRQSLLGQVIPSNRREPAATLALQHMLETAPDVASAFVERLMGGGFETGRIAAEWKFGRAKPDLIVYDAHGEARLFIENKLEASLTPMQPVQYLKQLPPHGQPMLAFIAPEDRAGGLWAELKERCRSAGYAFADESSTKHMRRMRVAKRAQTPRVWRWVLLTSWGWVFDTLQQAAAAEGHDAIEPDIAQLRGLIERAISSSLPSDGHEEPAEVSSDARRVRRPDAIDEPPGTSPVTDWRVARRMSNYASLIEGIVDRLVAEGVADTKGLSRSGWGRYLQLRTKFGVWLGVDLHSWSDRGMTPIWTRISASDFKGRVGQAKELFPDAHANRDRLCIPVRLPTGVVQDRLIDDAFTQIRSMADTLIEAFPEE